MCKWFQAVCLKAISEDNRLHDVDHNNNVPRLAKRREILIFPRTAGNTGNSQELLGNKLLTK